MTTSLRRYQGALYSRGASSSALGQGSTLCGEIDAWAETGTSVGGGAGASGAGPNGVSAPFSLP